MNSKTVKSAAAILFVVAAGTFIYKSIAKRVPAIAKAGSVVASGV